MSRPVDEAQLDTESAKTTNRHEFFKEGMYGTIVVFEGHEDEPFIRFKDDEIEFLRHEIDYDLKGPLFNITLMNPKFPKYGYAHIAYITTTKEFREYYVEAHSHHRTPVR